MDGGDGNSRARRHRSGRLRRNKFLLFVTRYIIALYPCDKENASMTAMYWDMDARRLMVVGNISEVQHTFLNNCEVLVIGYTFGCTFLVGGSRNAQRE